MLGGETSLPGVLAGGDIRYGSTKRVGFAVGDGSLAVTCAHRLLSIRSTVLVGQIISRTPSARRWRTQPDQLLRRQSDGVKIAEASGAAV